MSRRENASSDPRTAHVSPGRIVGGGSASGRSASPAKRRAEDMEGAEHPSQQLGHQPGAERDGGSGPWDVEMNEGSVSDQALDLQDPSTHSTPSSRLGSAGPQATAEEASPYSESHTSTVVGAPEPYTTAQIDEQVAKVRAMDRGQLDEGDRGICVSNTWLSRILSRTSEGLRDSKYPKEAREGAVGPLDNSDIVPEAGFDEPVLHDVDGQPFIPLKPGLTRGEEYDILPYDAFGQIVADYGSVQKTPITRWARNTAPPEAAQTNIQYELNPPVITIRKVPRPETEEPAAVRSKGSLADLRAKQERKKRGQMSPDDAVQLVSSSTERFQKFLLRAKEAAGIHRSTKVKIFKVQDAKNVSVDKPDNKPSGVLSPPASRSTSPEKASALSLVVSAATFKKMEIGVELEPTDAKDETNNEKYNGKSNMDMLGFRDDQTLLLEEQTGGPGGGEFQSDSKKPKTGYLGSKHLGSRPGSTTTSGRTSPAPGMVTRGRARKDGRTRGTVGLSNLGNTCYMNSALQCIRSVEELAIYFLTKAYKKEINAGNPLGFNGAMAHAYYTVVNGIYESTSSSSFSPTEFKRKLGTHQPMFSGYGQQDSQEFLSFLVDALHEDLNRIKKKPYFENPDSDDARIHDPEYIIELGETYRNNHKARNDSIAMDLFSGFYKNTMECPTCEKISITFDPYSLVTVQLPMEITWQHTVTYIPRRGKPVLHRLDVDKNWTIKQLKDFLATKHGANGNALWMAEVYNSTIFKAFDDATTVSEANIQANDHIFFYELDQPPQNAPRKIYSTSYSSKDKLNAVPYEGMESEKADVFSVPVFSRMKNNVGSFSKAMHPLYITVTREEAKDYEIILKKILIAVANVTSRKILEEFHADSGGSRSVEEVDAENDPNSSEDAAGVSDHSAQSEEGYVNLSLDKSPRDTEMTDGDGHGPIETYDEVTCVPKDFLDSRYLLSPALRNQLFEVKYAQSCDGLHCAGMSGWNENSARLMRDRVEKPFRRSSIQSASSEESTTSSTSETQTNDATDDSDTGGGIDDSPDLVIGDAGSLSADRVEENDEDADGRPPNSGIMEPSHVDNNGGLNRRGNRKNKSRGKKCKGRNRNGPITYAKKDRVRYGQQNRGLGGQFAAKHLQVGYSPYYIQLGEGIVLDWRPEAVDSLFGGDERTPNDMRGHRYTDDDGKHGRIFPDPEQDKKKASREARKKNGVELDDCFEATRRREILSEGNEWYCGRCKEMRQAAKTLEIWTLPDILVVHLKRFGGSRNLRDKIDLLVEYPIEGLDMNDKVGLKADGVDYTYDLFAVDLHFGGLGGGHYTAYAKNFYDGEWYEYNDSSVYKVSSEARVQSSAAYLLFYRRRSEKPLGPQELQDLVERYHKPPGPAEGADADDDDDAGECKLGGPTHSLHGSPSVLAGAGAGAKSLLKGRNGSGGADRGSNLTMKAVETSDDEDPGSRGLAGLRDGNPGWGFDNIDSAHALLDHMDNVSNAADAGDHDSAMGSDSDFAGTDAFISSTQTTPEAEQFIDVGAAAEHVEDPVAIDISLDDKMD